jgi:hypothetical protein
MAFCNASLVSRFTQLFNLPPVWKIVSLMLAMLLSPFLAHANTIVVQGHGNVIQQKTVIDASSQAVGCSRTISSGRCAGQSYAIGYPNEAVIYPLQGPATAMGQVRNPQEAHAAWLHQKRQYERVNQIYSQEYDALGNRSLNTPNGIRPYPSYADYVFRQKTQEFQKSSSLYMQGTESRVSTSYVIRKPQYRYITYKQAQQYDLLYKKGITTHRRPKWAVVR